MGLGSSAAFNVSIVAGLVKLFEIEDPVSHNFINAWAFQAEKVMHGTPSGIDNTVSTFGGTLTLTKVNGVNNIQHLER
jgi:mevalonate kinase